MQDLEILYEHEYKNLHFVDRKLRLGLGKILLKGVKKSGKSSLIFDFLTQFSKKDYLYIDLEDVRINKQIVLNSLESFVLKHTISLLVIENYDHSIMLPNLENIILTSHKNSLHVEGFEELKLYPLDFEEFIAFERRYSSIEQIFNQFTKDGTFASIVLRHENESAKALQELARILTYETLEYHIFKKFAELIGNKISLFQVYNQLKNSMKVSKDKLYSSVNALEDRSLIAFVPKLHFPNANKKIFLIDFAFQSALSFKKDFHKRFENMIFCELHKKYSEIFYSDYFDFYLPQEKLAIVSMPFLLHQTLQNKIEKALNLSVDLEIQRVLIISLGNEAQFQIKDIDCKLIPFWDWALS
ncbi:MAG: ATP-binding protein [Sulfurospirillum sp.]|nr:ATP-binding protein [Sulfurospirillum sp.]